MSGLDVSGLRNSLTFPKNLNISLTQYFNYVTYDLDEIVASLVVGTAKKQDGSNDTSFEFWDDGRKGNLYTKQSSF